MLGGRPLSSAPLAGKVLVKAGNVAAATGTGLATAIGSSSAAAIGNAAGSGAANGAGLAGMSRSAALPALVPQTAPGLQAMLQALARSIAFSPEIATRDAGTHTSHPCKKPQRCHNWPEVSVGPKISSYQKGKILTL
jgi:hypothetical protein